MVPISKELLARIVSQRKVSFDIEAYLNMQELAIKQEFGINQLGKQRNALKKLELTPAVVEEAKKIRHLLSEAQHTLGITHSVFKQLEMKMPNLIHPSVPIGNEDQAIVLKQGIKPTFDFKPRDHLFLTKKHDMLDIERAGKVSGTRSYYLKNAGAMLELALTRYAIDICIKKGFTPVIPPDTIRYSILESCGFSPRSDDPQTYYVSSHADSSPERSPNQLCLAATAEFPLAGMYSQETIPKSQLPIQMVASGHAFRAEGLAGSMNKGLYRVHQFTKVEMFTLCLQQEAMSTFEAFIEVQKQILNGLELCYRVLNMPSEELGNPAYIKYDMEAWMPGRDSWGEVSSTSNCTDYQAKRLMIKTNASKTEFVATGTRF